MIGILDYGMGNLGSVSNALAFLQVDARILRAPGELAGCRAIILPGVGAFGDCMAHLREHGFVEPVQAWVRAGRPYLGLCLGLQVLFAESEESPGVAGLGLLPGRVRRFQLAPEWKVPQIGWNRVRREHPDCPLFRDVPDESYFYFVHSYYADPQQPGIVCGSTDYGVRYASAVWERNLFAVQFHPEKSQAVGLQMLRNFADLNAGSA